MPRRCAPLLTLLLALSLVAYPATMPLAMAAEMSASMPMSMPGGSRPAHRQPPSHHHHALGTCCAGACGCCPVITLSAGVTPRIRASRAVITFQRDLRLTAQQSALPRLPYSIGPPRAARLA